LPSASFFDEEEEEAGKSRWLLLWLSSASNFVSAAEPFLK
jgi:hypothetical protein